jgi:hypothetical protein
MPLFPNEEGRRAAVRTLARIVGSLVVVFCFVDDHAHVVISTKRFPAVAARSLRSALDCISAAPLAPPHLKAVEDRAHLRNLVGYLLRQTDHHGLREHPATWSGSSFQDLVGARVIPEMSTRLGQLLPRFSMVDALGIVGIDEAPAPLENDEVRALGARRIVDAAAAAHAAPTSLTGRPPPVVAARRTAAHLAEACGVSRGEMQWALAVTDRSLRRIRGKAPSSAAIRATRIRLALEEIVARAALRKVG